MLKRIKAEEPIPPSQIKEDRSKDSKCQRCYSHIGTDGNHEEGPWMLVLLLQLYDSRVVIYNSMMELRGECGCVVLSGFVNEVLLVD
jgi:hypothetical protein